MKIINLIEDTMGRPGCVTAHGLSLYIETAKHTILMDLGPGESTLANALALDIDLNTVDIVVVSHGHYDHAGGVLPFTGINDHAVIYMQKPATGEFYAEEMSEEDDKQYRYIGMDDGVAKLSQVRFLEGDCVIDEELEIFTVKDRKRKIPFTNQRLFVKTANGYVQDDFSHEQYLVVKEGNKSLLLSGCAHNGILNIMDTYQERYASCPDMVISGFHINQSVYNMDELDEISRMAGELKKFPTKFVTCHCTGEVAHDLMNKVMDNRLGYLRCGETVTL